MEAEHGQPVGDVADHVHAGRQTVRDDALGKRASDVRFALVTRLSTSPTPRLLAGLGATLLIVALFTAYAVDLIEGLQQLQANIIDRNRQDSLQLIRIQNDLNSLGLAMRDMTEDPEAFGIQTWRPQFQRLEKNLKEAIRIDSAVTMRPLEQRQFLQRSLEQFFVAAEQVFRVAETGDQERAKQVVLDSLQAQQASLAATVARLLVQNNEAEEAAAREIASIYRRAERDVYLFLAAMLAGITAIGLGAAHYNRRLFDQVASLSDQRSTLARRLIGVQEEVFRSVARELHDEFGQILTAIGAMLHRAGRKHVPPDTPLYTEIAEVRQIAQEALEKTRSFSQALHPTVLDDYGLEHAIERYVPAWRKQTGIDVEFVKQGSGDVTEKNAIHVYRILQEALHNIARHSRAQKVRICLSLEETGFTLEIADNGVGMNKRSRSGLGLIAMRERAELIGGRLRVESGVEGGTTVKLEVSGTE